MALMQRLAEIYNIPPKFLNDVACIIAANVINNTTIFAANIIIARYYPQEFFGLFSIAVNIALLTLTISEFGMNLSMIRLYKKHQGNPSRSRAVLLTNFYFKALMLLVLIVIGLVAGRFFANVLMHDGTRWVLAAVALASGGVLGFWSFIRAYLQAMERFRAIAVQTISYAILRMVFLCALIVWTGATSEEWFLLTVYIVPLFFILWWGFSTFNREIRILPIHARELMEAGSESIQYSWWVALAGISFVLIQQSMIYIVSIVGGVQQVALLSAGLVFTAVFSLVNDAINQVLFSKLSGMEPTRIAEYRHRLLRFSPLFVLGSVVMIACLSALMSLFLDERYSRSLYIFWVTSVATAATAYIGYYSMVMHTIQRPQLGAYVNFVTLIFFCVSGAILMKYVSLLAVTVAYMFALILGEFAKTVLVNRSVMNPLLKV